MAPEDGLAKARALLKFVFIPGQKFIARPPAPSFPELRKDLFGSMSLDGLTCSVFTVCVTARRIRTQESS